MTQKTRKKYKTRPARDRVGETYGDYKVIAKGEEEGTWIIQCICGTKRVATAKSLSTRKNCGCRNKQRLKQQSALTFAQNTLEPERRRLKHDALYEIRCNKFQRPVIGKLVHEYKKSASFEIVNCHEFDRTLARNLNKRINVRKKDVKKCS